MQRLYTLFSLLLCLVLFLSACETTPSERVWDSSLPVAAPIPDEPAYEAKSFDPVKAMWLSQYDLSPLYLQNGKQRPQADYTQRIRQVCQNVASVGINTVFVQVRPNGDSLYPSALFPSSPYAVGTIGEAFAYDPFEILLKSAHEAGLSVHAWINPYRCFTEQNRQLLSGDCALLSLCDGDRMVRVGNTWYLNPAYDTNVQRITDGVSELLARYPVDGVHIDDYFYPTTGAEFDAKAYAAYKAGGGTLSLADFRRKRVSCMIRALWATVHSADGERLFGVSPGGNTARNYHELYADVAAWCAEGTLDYLCPQVYFGLEHATVPFLEVCHEFADMVRGTGVRLIVGMTLEKAHKGYHGTPDRYAGVGANEWIQHRDILSRCLLLAEELPECRGVAYFSYQFFFSPEDGVPPVSTEEERQTLLPLLRQAQF